MHTVNFIVLRLKKVILPAIFCLFILLMLLFSKSNLASSKSGLGLWANSIVPSLLPFFIATELLSHTFVVPLLGRALNGIMRPLFNVPGEGAFALIMGIISGYPTGAKIVTGFYKDDICTLEEAERLIAFTNNSGPLFIVGTVGVSMFGDSRTGMLLLITHIMACITVGILFRFWKTRAGTRPAPTSCINSNLRFHHSENCVGACLVPARNSNRTRLENSVNLSNLGDVLSTSIMNSIKTILLIGGFVVLFSVIISMLTQSHTIKYAAKIMEPAFSFLQIDSKFSESILCGLLELTNGIKAISQIPSKAISHNIIISSFLLGFGGLSVMLQVLSIISKAKISAKPYIIGKALHGIFAALYTYAFLNLGLFFNLDVWKRGHFSYFINASYVL